MVNKPNMEYTDHRGINHSGIMRANELTGSHRGRETAVLAEGRRRLVATPDAQAVRLVEEFLYVKLLIHHVDKPLGIRHVMRPLGIGEADRFNPPIMRIAESATAAHRVQRDTGTQII